MTTKRLALCAVLLAATVAAVPAGAAPSAPAHGGVPDAAWKPWTALLDRDPYDVPAAAGRLRGVEPASRCAALPAVDLGTAVARLADALHVDDSLTPGLALAPDTAAYLARMTDCLAAHVPHLPAYDGDALGAAADPLRAAWLGAMTDLVALAKAAPVLSTLPSGCVDPLCLIQTGGPGADTYTQDAALIVDEGGSDTYSNNTGGAPAAGGIARVALLLDLGGDDDLYAPTTSDLFGRPTNGSGYYGGVGVLVDQGGADHYCGLGGTMGAGYAGAGLLLDLGGDDEYESNDPDSPATAPCVASGVGSRPGQSHKVDHGGGAFGGFGFLLDAAGDDEYVNYGVDSMGWGADAGTGLLLDASGNDTYTVHSAVTGCGTGSTCTDEEHSGVSLGVGEITGVGVLLDGGGDDGYGCTEDVFYGCMGATTGGLLGLLFDAGGTDTYVIGPMAPGPGQRAAGIGAAEVSHPPQIDVGYHVVPGVAVFADAGGADTYTSSSAAAAGWGNTAPALFLDVAGTDTYNVPGTPRVGTRADGQVWIAGALRPSGVVLGPSAWFGVGIDLPL